MQFLILSIYSSKECKNATKNTRSHVSSVVICSLCRGTLCRTSLALEKKVHWVSFFCIHYFLLHDSVYLLMVWSPQYCYRTKHIRSCIIPIILPSSLLSATTALWQFLCISTLSKLGWKQGPKLSLQFSGKFVSKSLVCVELNSEFVVVK